MSSMTNPVKMTKPGGLCEDDETRGLCEDDETRGLCEDDESSEDDETRGALWVAARGAP